MKISGFMILYNAELMGYPFQESIQSLLPLVDEMIVAIGDSKDKTKEKILALNNPKIRIIDTVWDEKNIGGGKILSAKTNEALLECRNNWCFYLQADEVLHEKDLENIKTQLLNYENDTKVEGLHFKYIHFYGSYSVVATSRKWYREEVRIIKKNSGAQSSGDAQGFKINNKLLKTKSADATIYHYGWVKPPKIMARKCKLFHHWWYGDLKDAEFENFYYKKQYGLKKYSGEHPIVMQSLVLSQDWECCYKRAKFWSNWSDLRLALSDLIEKIIGRQPFQRKVHE